MNSVRLEDIYWTAGFLEGEACFLKTGGSISVVCSQVQKEPIDRLNGFFPGSVLYLQRNNPKHNNFYRWSVYGEFAEHLMKLIYPIMSPKRQAKINELLSWYSTLPGKNYARSGRKFCRNGEHPWTEENTFVKKGSVTKSGKEIRCCRICDRENKNRWQRQHRQVNQN